MNLSFTKRFSKSLALSERTTYPVKSPASRPARSIHSVYNPGREAERYINSLNLNGSYSYLILIECGFGYVIPFLKKRLPQAKIISLHLSQTYLFANSPLSARPPSAPDGGRPDAEWHPGSNISLWAFLERETGDTESDKIKVIEWRAARALDPGKYLEIMRETVNFIKYAGANKRTELYFGKIWERNAHKNIQIAKSTQSGPLNQPCSQHHRSAENIIIAGSSPGLERDAELIKKMKAAGNCSVLALSSAVAALKARNIMPDMVITTDGGAWARLHLQALSSVPAGAEPRGKPDCPPGKKPLIIAALHAALLSDFASFPCILFSDGSQPQNALLSDAGLPLRILPRRGTVAASAIDFALRRTSGSLYITGIDFRGEDIRFHARPYMLDVFLSRNESRFNPSYSIQYKRTAEINRGDSYRLYKEWFKRQNYPARLFSLSDPPRPWRPDL